MPTYDILMIVVLGITTFMGAIKGLAWQIASLASIVLSYFAAYRFRGDVAKLIQAQEPWNGFLAMLLIYAGSSFAIWVVFRLLSGVIDQFRMRDFDRHMGALVGFGKGLLLCVLITMFAVTLLGPKQQQAIVNSRSGTYISQFLSATNGIVWPKEIEPIIRPYLAQAEQRLDPQNSGDKPNAGSNPLTASQGQGGWFGSGSPFPGGSPQAEPLGNGSWQLPLPGNPVTTPNPTWPNNNSFNDVLPAFR